MCGVHHQDLPPDDATRFLQVSRLGLEFKKVRVAQHGDDGSCGHQLVQQSEQLGGQGSNDKDDAGDVAARSVEACDQTSSDGIGSYDEYDRRRRGCGFGCVRRPTARPNDRGHLPADEIGRQSRYPIWLIVRPAILDSDVLVLNESGVVETLPERIKNVFEPRSRRRPEKSDHRHRRLLRAGRKRPRRRRAAKRGDEVAPGAHSITSSARASSVGGSVKPIALAVVRLMTNSSLVGNSIGSSAAFVPFRILSTKYAVRRRRSPKSVP